MPMHVKVLYDVRSKGAVKNLDLCGSLHCHGHESKQKHNEPSVSLGPLQRIVLVTFRIEINEVVFAVAVVTPMSFMWRV